MVAGMTEGPLCVGHQRRELPWQAMMTHKTTVPEIKIWAAGGSRCNKEKEKEKATQS